MEHESTPYFEFVESVFLKSKSKFNEKPRKSIESKQKRVESQNNFSSESY